MSLKKYAIIKNKENSLTIGEVIEVIDEQAIPVPLLWIDGEGRYCLLSKEVIQNLLDLYNSFQQTQGDFNYKLPKLDLSWNQGIEISSDIGRILAGE